MEYSPAVDSDKPYFQDLHEQCYRDVVTRQFGSWEPKTQRLNFDARWLVQQFSKIIIDGNVVGGIWLDEHDEFRQIREIQIHPTYQGQGIGTRVVQDVIYRSQQMDKKLMLKVLHENHALALYERLGFVVTDDTGVQYVMEHRAQL
jgi:ribosomal protein S18 acetylase RimI-like enzyme